MDTFIVKVLMSFLIGGGWVSIVTVIGEKLGSKIGGFLVGLPSTIVFTLLFIGWTQSEQDAIKATTIIPALGGVSALFIVIYSILVKRNFYLAIIGSITFWCMAAFPLVYFNFNSFKLSLLIYLLVAPTCFVILEFVLKIKSVSSTRNSKVKPSIVLFRMLLSGTIVASGVIFSKLGGPLVGGMFAMFPAMFTSAIVINYLSQGAEFTLGVMKSALISSITLMVYAIIVRYYFEDMGIFLGTFVAFSVSVFCAILLKKFVIGKLK